MRLLAGMREKRRPIKLAKPFSSRTIAGEEIDPEKLIQEGSSKNAQFPQNLSCFRL
jgi:hypothetical protein